MFLHNRIMHLLPLVGAIACLLFPAPSVCGTPDDPCELVRVLGGEEAYQECLARYAAPEREVPVSPPPALPSPSLPPAPAPVAPSGQRLSASDLFEQVKKSVFIVVAARNLTELKRDRASQGSAVAVSSTRLYTNCHVVDGRSLLVLYQDGELFEARLVGSDKKTDRCILEVDTPSLRPVSGLRDFASLRVGEKVFTVGAPHGLEHSLGEGLVSGKRQYLGVDIIQTTAPISPGSSGGGLFDEQGRLVGITSFLLEDGQSLNFAIAADAFGARQPVPSGGRAPASSTPSFIGR